MDTWNKRMARALADSGYTPNSFAVALKVSAPTVSAWIGAGTITPAEHIKGDHLLRACALLGISPRWLLYKQGPMRGIEQAKLTDEMQQIIDALIDIDRIDDARRTDIIFWINRLLRPDTQGDQKTAPNGKP